MKILKIYIGDQGDRAFWRRFKSEVPALDIVIDDGSHDPDHQILTFEELLPHMRRGVSTFAKISTGVRNAFSAYVQGLVGALNTLEWADVSAHPGESIGIPANSVQRTFTSVSLYPFVTVFELAENPTSRIAAERHGDQWTPPARV